MTTLDDANSEVIDAALAIWRQGDCVVDGEHWFVHRRASENVAASDEAPGLEEQKVPGLVIITQSCDIVRKYASRPLVAVSPLQDVTGEQLAKISKGHRPQYAAIPGVSGSNLVADLDRVMTIDKRIVAEWTRAVGCTTDEERRDFARAVERKFGRFAFPDDFNKFAAKLQDRIKEKHGRAGSEGDALRELAEIRVRAAPSWDSTEVELMFWFIAEPERAREVRERGFLPIWGKLIQPGDRFNKVNCQITTHAELTAQEYLESDRLDLDHLSIG